MNVFAAFGYPETIISQFSELVIQHISSLPSDYFKMMREFTENGPYVPAEASYDAYGFDFMEDYKQILSPDVLARKYLVLCGCALEDLTSGYHCPVAVGNIEGAPVLFLREAGKYFFKSPDASGLLEVGLTGAFYPPVLPNKLQ